MLGGSSVSCQNTLAGTGRVDGPPGSYNQGRPLNSRGGQPGPRSPHLPALSTVSFFIGLQGVPGGFDLPTFPSTTPNGIIAFSLDSRTRHEARGSLSGKIPGLGRPEPSRATSQSRIAAPRIQGPRRPP
ncbi:hypothetical protein LY76DRAFT_172690 [Colletotrichum caudatum]|nr:hypothetical protein LY76DRAFT_172690 [Colletotrichum caudatum]